MTDEAQQHEAAPEGIPENPQVIEKTTSGINKFLVLTTLISVIIIAVLTFVVGYFLGEKKNTATTTPIQTPQTAKQEHGLKGVLVLVDGTVVIKKDDSWQAITKGTTIEQGSTIRTGPQSRAVIELDDGSAVRLDQNTEVVFSTLNADVIMLNQIAGRIYNRVNPGKLLYNVKSFETVATALGTSFSVNSDSTKQLTEVAVLESKVALLNKDKETKETVVDTGQFATVDSQKQVKIASISKDLLKEEFYTWNDTLNKEASATAKPSETPKPTTKPEPSKTPKPSQTNTGFTLSAQTKDEGVLLSWNFSGDASKGFKIVASKEANPSFPKDMAKYITTTEARSYKWTGLEPGVTYHFRVGVYNGEGITQYSNDVTAVAPQKLDKTEKKSTEGSFSGSISLSGSSNDGGKVSLHWDVSGGEASGGFKLCKGENPNPTYKVDSCGFMEAHKRDYTWEGLSSGKTYHFRIGAYVGGDVGASPYSNNVSVSVK